MENRWKCFLYLFIFLIISHSTFSLTPANILLSYLLSDFSKNSLVTLSPTHSEHLVLSPLPVHHAAPHTLNFFRILSHFMHATSFPSRSIENFVYYFRLFMI